MYIVKFDNEYIKSYDIERINSKTVLKNVKTTDNIEDAMWMGAEDAAKLTALLKLRHIIGNHIFESINVNDIKENSEVEIKEDSNSYVIQIDDRFIHSIIVNNKGIVDCYETFDIDIALKIGDYVQAVCLRTLLESVDENVVVSVLEIK